MSDEAASRSAKSGLDGRGVAHKRTVLGGDCCSSSDPGNACCSILYGIFGNSASVAGRRDRRREPQAIRNAFERRISADYITSVSSKDLEIRKNGAGAWEARVAYEKVVPLVANVSLLFSFEAKAPR